MAKRLLRSAENGVRFCCIWSLVMTTSYLSFYCDLLTCDFRAYLLCFLVCTLNIVEYGPKRNNIALCHKGGKYAIMNTGTFKIL